MNKPIREQYFAASNSGDGFYSLFGEIFNPNCLKRVYIIKGGPGTGKNMLMKKIAEASEEKGLCVVYYYCSSDANSLDGIIIDGRVAVIDGTSPHATDTKFPGAVDEIVDLGVFWSSERLMSGINEIKEKNEEKARLYKYIYSVLSAYKAIDIANTALIRDKVADEKISVFAKNLVSGKEGSSYTEKNIFSRSIGMAGDISFLTFFEAADEVIEIKDYYGVANLLLHRIRQNAISKDLSVKISYDPINPNKIDGIFIEDTGLAILLGHLVGETRDKVVKTVNMRRFVSGFSEEKAKVLSISRGIQKKIFDNVLSSFEEIKRLHFNLEEIYKGAMDFEGKEDFTKKLIKKIEKDC